MAKKKASDNKIKGVPVKMDGSSVEKETMLRVSKTLATLERFLSRWDATARKPAALLPMATKIRRFHDALMTWQKQVARAGKQGDDATRMGRLREFVAICRMYS